MRTWSLSPFFNEVDVLEIRLAELDPVIDVFVLIEARMTHMGVPRELVYPQVEDRYARWAHKIRYLPIDFPEGMTDWQRESYQREACGAALKGIADEDIVMITDLDEIPRAETVLMEKELPCAVSFPIHPYRLDWRWDEVDHGHCVCTFISARDLEPRGDGFYMGAHKGIAPSSCVYTAEPCEGHTHLLGNYGWHFTYIGDEEAILDKTSSIADKWVKGVATPESARAAIREGRDVFGRNKPVSRVPIKQLPVYVQDNRERFAHILTEQPE